MKNLDSQKTAAIQTLESEIAKLEIQAKDKKELEPQVKELKEQLAQLKASQQKEQASMSTFQKWFTWGGWSAVSKETEVFYILYLPPQSQGAIFLHKY